VNLYSPEVQMLALRLGLFYPDVPAAAISEVINTTLETLDADASAEEFSRVVGEEVKKLKRSDFVPPADRSLGPE
jgi:hypothetical protein